MNALVTGASGFIGWHLVDSLAREGHHVTAWTRSVTPQWPDRSVAVVTGDVEDVAATRRVLDESRPEVIVHLAAQSLPTRSWAEPVATMRTNVIGTMNLLELLQTQRPLPRLLIAGTSAQYASTPRGEPIPEDAPLEPSSPYAVSKVAAEACGRLYARVFKLDVVFFRPFFWIGPRKVGDVASDVARRVVEIERGAQPELRVGRTDPVRDLIDVRDGVMALLRLIERGESGQAYNICRGEGTSIADVIGAFRARSRRDFAVVTDPALVRPIDEPVRVGDPSRMRALGWAPTISVEQSVAAILDFWRSVAPASAAQTPAATR